MIKADRYYKDNIMEILETNSKDLNPRPKYKDGTPAHSMFINNVFEKYDISKGEFPITTLRNTAIKMGIQEIRWIYQIQDSSLESAEKLGVNWWTNWDIGNYSVGERYGATIKRYDMMNKLLANLEKDPFSRRHIMNMYQEESLQATPGLYPCAYETIWTVKQDKDENLVLNLTLIQRSNDYLVAGCINKVQYTALLMMVAGHLGYKVGEFCHFVGNLHIYDRHIDAANEIINKSPLSAQPFITLESRKNFYEYTIDDFKIFNIEGITKIKSPLELAI